jgi:hypothetical protein
MGVAFPGEMVYHNGQYLCNKRLNRLSGYDVIARRPWRADVAISS